MKINKIVIIAGVVVMAFVLSKVNSGDLTTNDVVLMMQKNGMSAESTEGAEDEGLNNSSVQSSAINEATDSVSEKITGNSEKELSILAFGDLMLGRYVRVLMDEKGHNYPFEKLGDIKNIFSKDEDIVFANLEGPIKGDGIRSETSMNFGFPDYLGDLLVEKGISLVSLANNHTLNMGVNGFNSTTEILKDKEIGYCGEPEGISENSVYYGASVDDNGNDVSYAFVCFHSAMSDLDLDQAYKLIEDVRPKVDFLIVSIHWGVEYKHTPDESKQIDVGHAFVDHGADLVIGHHPHVVQPFEIYKDRFIFYSLGNFVFDQYWSAETQKELAVGITLSKDSDGKIFTGAELFPMKSETSQPRLLTSEEYAIWAEEFIGYWNFTEDQKTEIRSGVIDNP